ncbi:MAG: lipopolysaccharide heptosyltransferase II [Simkaniaceae bacterium]
MAKNTLFRILLKLFQPLQKQNSPHLENYLIVSSTGVGDSLWGTPAVRIIKKTYPNARVSLLTSPVGYEIFKNSPYIDEFFIVRDPLFPKLIPLYKKLKKRRFAKAFVLHSSQRPLLPLLAFLQIPVRIGTAGLQKGLDDLLTDKIPWKISQHEIARRLSLIKTPLQDNGQLEIFLDPEEHKRGREIAAGQTNWIVLHPGAKDSFKKWPAENFIELGRLLARKIPKSGIAITGNSQEQDLCRNVAANIPKAVSLAGKISLREMAAFLDHVSLFITNDTGPMHLAFARKTPTIALFSGTDPKLCGPYQINNKAWVVKRMPTCTPCLKKKCRSPFCLMQITPKEIYNLVINIWVNKAQKNQNNQENLNNYEKPFI